MYPMFLNIKVIVENTFFSFLWYLGISSHLALAYKKNYKLKMKTKLGFITQIGH